MSEIKKNIETCRGEDVLAEVSAAPQDPHFGSLVNEAFDPMQQQALHQAGYDGYSEVIEQHKPYTFASFIVQMKSNLLLLLHALWQFPFGSGTLRSLSDMWQHYITRLSGNETYGIPSRLSSLTDLPSAPLLLADRKISGVPEAEDGMSLVNLIAQPSAVQTITDNNVYDCSKTDLVKTLASLFPNLSTLHLGFETLTATIFNQGTLNVDTIIFDNMKTATTSPLFTIGNNGTDRLNMSSLQFPKAEKIGCLFCYFSNGWWTGAAPNLEELEFPALIEITSAGGGRGAFIEVPCTGLKTLDLSKVQSMGRPLYGGSCLQGLEELDLSGTSNVNLCHGTYPANISTVLLLLKIKEGFANSLNLTYWSPTLTNDNLATFLSNFRTYIALRLTDNGYGKTLTLSQAVYDAIKDESHLFVFDEGTMTIYAYLTNIKHWTVTK